eukprot:scaffold60504_cov47-Attheya_sp.AAC.1
MKVGAGPHDMGFKTAHYCQVLLTYLYLANTGVRRCGWPDFAHTMIHLDWKIESRVASFQFGVF